MKLPKLTDKKMLILELLLTPPLHEWYGLDLIAAAKGKLRRGTIYVLLEWMEESGWVVSRLEQFSQSGYPRRLYRITSKGEAVYNAQQA